MGKLLLRRKIESLDKHHGKSAGGIGAKYRGSEKSGPLEKNMRGRLGQYITVDQKTLPILGEMAAQSDAEIVF
jgi:hypothetical protein